MTVRLWIALGLLAAGAALVAAGWFAVTQVEQAAYQRGMKDGRAEVTAAWREADLERAKVAAAAATEFRRIEQRRNTLVMEASNAAKRRETVLRAAADRADSELGRVRDDLARADAALAARGGDVPGPALDACRRYASALGAVLLDIGEEATRLARAADGHASDVLMLEQAWPK